MKLIAEHLGEIIVALAGVALLVLACTVFKAPISDFFEGIVEKLTASGNSVLDSIAAPNLTPVIE